MSQPSTLPIKLSIEFQSSDPEFQSFLSYNQPKNESEAGTANSGNDFKQKQDAH